jgi:hypothetical protein
MYRTTSLSLALLASALAVSGARAQSDGEVLLKVHVSDVEYTDYYPVDDCPSGSECIVFYTWFRYRARVVEVVRGHYSQRTVAFANLQHAHYARRPRNWYVLLVPCGQSVRDAVHVEYCVKDHAFDPVELERIGVGHGA